MEGKSEVGISKACQIERPIVAYQEGWEAWQEATEIQCTGRVILGYQAECLFSANGINGLRHRDGLLATNSY